ncbi:FHA domain-containing protein [Nymphaea thermarum]|nr:FHA domain-containing protein [Nymphaea thermarum]
MTDWENMNMETGSSYSPNPYEEDQFDEDEQYSDNQSYGQSSWEHYEELGDGEHSLNEQPNEPYQFSYGKVWFESASFHSQTSYPSSSHVTESRRYEKPDQGPRRYQNPHGQTTLTRKEEKDLVLGIYEKGKHHKDITLVRGTELRRGPRMMVIKARTSPKCDLMFQHPSIHEYHFEFKIDKDSRKMWVTNVTRNGVLSVATTVIRPQETVRVYPGDTLRVGDSSRECKLEWVCPTSNQGKERHPPKFPSTPEKRKVEGKSGLTKEREPKEEPLKLWQQNVKKIEELLRELKEEQALLKPKPDETHNAMPKMLTEESDNISSPEEASMDNAGLCMATSHKKMDLTQAVKHDLSKVIKSLPKEGGVKGSWTWANQFLHPNSRDTVVYTLQEELDYGKEDDDILRPSNLEHPIMINLQKPTWGEKLSWLKRRQYNLSPPKPTFTDIKDPGGKVDPKATSTDPKSFEEKKNRAADQSMTLITSSLHRISIEHSRMSKAWLYVRLIFDPGTHEPRLHNWRRLKSQLGIVPRDYGPRHELRVYEDEFSKGDAAEAWKRRTAIEGNRLAPLFRLTARVEQHKDGSKRLQGQGFDRRTCQNPTWGDHTWAKHLQGRHESLLGSLPRHYGPHSSHKYEVGEMSWNDFAQSTLDDCEGRAWGQARSKEGGIDTSLTRTRTPHKGTSTEGAQM